MQVSALGSDAQWERAQALVDSMPGHGLQPDAFTHTALMHVLKQGGQFSAALRVFDGLEQGQAAAGGAGGAASRRIAVGTAMAALEHTGQVRAAPTALQLHCDTLH